MRRMSARYLSFLVLIGGASTQVAAQTGAPAPGGIDAGFMLSWAQRVGAALVVGAVLGLLFSLLRKSREMRRHAIFGALGAALALLVANLDDFFPRPLSELRFELMMIGIDYTRPVFSNDISCFTTLCFLANRYDVFFEVLGALLALLVLWFWPFLEFMQGGSETAFDPREPSRRLALAFLVTVAAGVVLLFGTWLAWPRDSLGRLGGGGYAALIAGAALVLGVPFAVWRRVAPRMQFAVLAAALAAAGVVTLNVGQREPVLFAGFGCLFVAFLIFREWRRIGRVQGAGLLRVSAAAFCWPFARRSVIAETSAALGDEVLTAAFQLPDHTLRARSILAAELAKRGQAHTFDPEWLPPPERATLPPAVHASIAPERYRRWMRNRRVMQAAFMGLTILAFVTVVGLVLLPLIVTVGLIGSLIGRKRAARVLLLRPFGQPRMTRALKRVVRRHLGLLGHSYTLSDRNYRPNFLLAAVSRMFDFAIYVFGPILRPSLRIARVTNERSFLKLADFLLRSWSPSWKALICGGQAFNIRTTDDWWKRCIDLLMRSSDVVVMDISRVSAGSAWEIVRLSEHGLLSKCVFIAQSGHHADALASFERLLPPDTHLHVHVFDERGVVADSAALDAVLEGQILAAVGHWGDARPAIGHALALAS